MLSMAAVVKTFDLRFFGQTKPISWNRLISCIIACSCISLTWLLVIFRPSVANISISPFILVLEWIISPKYTGSGASWDNRGRIAVSLRLRLTLLNLINCARDKASDRILNWYLYLLVSFWVRQVSFWEQKILENCNQNFNWIGYLNQKDLLL